MWICVNSQRLQEAASLIWAEWGIVLWLCHYIEGQWLNSDLWTHIFSAIYLPKSWALCTQHLVIGRMGFLVSFSPRVPISSQSQTFSWTRNKFWSIRHMTLWSEPKLCYNTQNMKKNKSEIVLKIAKGNISWLRKRTKLTISCNVCLLPTNLLPYARESLNIEMKAQKTVLAILVYELAFVFGFPNFIFLKSQITCEGTAIK